MNPAPLLHALTRHLAETPAPFLAEPRLGRHGQLYLPALVSDLLLLLGGAPLSVEQAAAFSPKDKTQRNQARLLAICCWLLYAEELRAALAQQPERLTLLTERLRLGPGELAELAGLIDAERFISEAERREELARRVLAWLQLRPAGESEHQAADRLSALDSIERERVLSQARARKEAAKARQLKKQMAEQQAREAAAKANREW
ncbi:MAG: hypothetical protein H7842_11100 [Gammaproteobacteria bacterium SHHR-1]|uniref:hypothetical protein n=1 Tax=Magnetovirga frankeli TaxID=947516 RepID=UPI001293CF36|nr:hypothetical protein D5125_07890 [gamma proteobacterium SS-5]